MKISLVFNTIVPAVILYFLVQAKILVPAAAIGFFIFILFIMFLQNATRVKFQGDISGKDMKSQKLQDTKTIFVLSYKKAGSSVYINLDRKTAKLHISENGAAIEMDGEAKKLTKENLIFDNLPAQADFGLRLDEGEYYFKSLFDIKSLLEDKI